jgi:hypothetical protein
VLLILVLISRPLAMLYPLVMLADGKKASTDAFFRFAVAGLTSYRFSCTRPAKP